MQIKYENIKYKFTVSGRNDSTSQIFFFVAWLFSSQNPFFKTKVSFSCFLGNCAGAGAGLNAVLMHNRVPAVRMK